MEARPLPIDHFDRSKYLHLVFWERLEEHHGNGSPIAKTHHWCFVTVSHRHRLDTLELGNTHLSIRRQGM